MPAIDVRNLVLQYGDFKAVNDVSFSINEGEVFGLLGPNGSGKTTIIKALCGLLKIAGGSGSVLGVDVSRDPQRVKNSIGYMSQKFGLYEDLTARENIEFYGGVYGLGAERFRRRFDEVVELTKIEPYLDRRAGFLSGGWKQRLALASAIVHSPPVVFLDEPTAGIDPVARRALWDLIFDLSATGVTFLVTTHYMDEAERCSRVGYLYLSRLIALGTVDELRAHPDANPAGTRRVEVEADGDIRRLTEIRRLPFVREAIIFGRSFHLLVDEHVADAVISQAAGGAAVSAVTPTLEDVFVTMTYRANEAQAAR